jgi:WD40 repeat protein
VDRYGDPLPDGAIARLGTIRFRGADGPLAFSPDGKLLATGAADSASGVIFWDRATGKQVRRLRAGNVDAVRCLSFSPDGKMIACFYGDQGHVLRVADGRLRFTIRGAHGTFAPDGKRLVSADRAGDPPHAYVYDPATGNLRRKWPLGTKAANGTRGQCLDAAGRTLVRNDGPVPYPLWVCDLTTGKYVHSRVLVPGGRCSLTLSPDGKELATGEGRGVYLWNVASGKELAHWTQDAGCDPGFSPDGKVLAWIGYDERLDLHHVSVATRGQARPRTVGPPAKRFRDLCFSPDGKSLAFFTEGSTVMLLDVATGREALPLDAHTSAVIGLSPSADGCFLVSRDSHGVITWDLKTGRLLRRFPSARTDGERAFADVAGGKVLVGDPKDGTIRVRDGATAKEVVRLEEKYKIDRVAVSADGSRAGFFDPDGKPHVFDLRSGKGHPLPGTDLHPLSLDLSPHGDYLLSFCIQGEDEAEVFLDTNTGRSPELKRLVEAGLIRSFRASRFFSPDDRWFVLPYGDRIRRWDTRTMKELTPLQDAQERVYSVVFSPDSRYVAACGDGGPIQEVLSGSRSPLPTSVRVWEVTTGRRLSHLDRKLGSGVGRLFTADYRTLITCEDGTISLWELATGQKRGHFKGHLDSGVSALALSADGRTLFSGGDDSQVFAWDLTGRPAKHGDLRRQWEALAGTDGIAAYRASWALALDPERSLPFLKKHLAPVQAPDAAKVARLLAELDDKRFAVRRRAAEELEKLGEPVCGALRKALAGGPTLESRRRLEELLEKINRPVPVGDSLRALRAVETLEHMGSDGASKLLAELAAGAPEARLTREAKASLRRLRAR